MKFRKQSYAHPVHHVTVKQKIKLKSGVTNHFIVLYIKPLGSEKPIVFRELINYFETNSNSGSWQRQVARAIGLFYDFCVEKAPAYKNDNDVADTIRGFIQCSLSGDSGLGWTPSSAKTVRRNVGYILDFSRYIGLNGTLPKSPSKIHKEYFFRASQVKNNSFLSHVTDVNKVAARLQATSIDHIFKFSKSTTTTTNKVSQFPEDLIEPLLNEGFKLRNGRENIGAKMITMLLIFGGLRESEPFHLWFNDFNIYPSSGKLEISLHHPSESSCDIPPYKNKSRAEYLLERGLLPRDNENNSNSYYAGWKDLALDKDYTTPIRLIHEDAEILFVKLFKQYMHEREVCMRDYKAKYGYEHPFFFVKTGDVNDLGAPMSINSYLKAFKQACKRLRKLGYYVEEGAKNGIAPHSMRHWFASILEEAGVPPKVLQDMMNHRSILSQEIYKSANKRAIDEALKNVAGVYLLSLKGM
ncbi:tyrosine-type recombinase/integrase [Vibrio cholerae]|uniref:site-specific integrase n=1 Tax=Vibrio cholerae TaxID=666 RepID=UPI0011DA01DD|nr:site-specific integrase [Vibrio cholerae]TXY12296.1 site-specific integrase [Vibrio cholerae]TXY57368.1 site-specific integrase [Vibrio cholerae]GHW30896.1 integrase [Vibrio cholerae]GHX23384.1 integrase [Vibrio cholerae]GHY10801.1 integrase [Vibrio cholerae]